MTGVITWVVDSGDGVYIGGKQTPSQPTQIPHRTMSNTELTLDQLQAVAGGAIHPSYLTGPESRGIILPSYLTGPESRAFTFQGWSSKALPWHRG